MKPSSPLRTSVSRWRSPWTLPAPVLENDAITIRAPASMAASYGARWIAANASSSMSARRPGRSSSRASSTSPTPVPPSPIKCLAVAAAEPGAVRSPPWRPRDERAAELRHQGRVLAVALVARPHRTSCGTATTGPKSQRIPVAAISAAVASPIRSDEVGSWAAPSPTCAGRSWRRRRCCGRGRRRRRRGSGCRGASRARRPGRPRTIRYQPPASFWGGEPPPPLRTEPRSRSVTPCGSTEPCSSWVIWPIFSSSVISASSAAARVAGGRLASCQSTAADADPAGVDGGADDAGDAVGVDDAHPATSARASRRAPGRPRRITRQEPWAMLQIVQYWVRRRRGCSRTVRIANAMSSGWR